MAHKTNTFDASSSVVTATAAGAIEFTLLYGGSDGVDYHLDQVFSRHQLTVVGLDGGTFDVTVMAPGVDRFSPLPNNTNLAEATLFLIESPVVKAIRVNVSGMGNAAAPELTLTSMPRMS